jgi:hypothetical protein
LIITNVEFKVTLLFQIKEQECKNRAEDQFDEIDRDMEQAMKCAANKCRYVKYRKHSWSEQVRTATYNIRYWRKRREIAQQRRQADDTIIFYMTQAGYPPGVDHDLASEIQCRTEIINGKSLMQAELGRQKELVISKRRTLTESKLVMRRPELSENDDLSSNIQRKNLIENQLKQMINKEDKNRIFTILRHDIKAPSTLPASSDHSCPALTSLKRTARSRNRQQRKALRISY